MKHAEATDITTIVAAIPSVLLIGAGVLLPVLLLARVSLFAGGGASGFGIGAQMYEPGTWSLAAYGTVLSDGYVRSIVGFTVALTAAATAATMVVATPLSAWIARLPRRLGDAALLAVLLPKLSNMLVVIYGLKLAISADGLLNSALTSSGLVGAPIDFDGGPAGVLLGQCFLLFPYPVLMLTVAFRNLDGRLIDAARGLGAGRWQTFWRVTMPLCRPTFMLAAGLSAVWTFGAFVAPYLLGGPEQFTVAVDVQRQAFENLNWPRAAATAIVLLAFATLCIALVELSRRLSSTAEPTP